MDANVPPSNRTAGRGKPGAKPTTQTKSSPDLREQGTPAGGGNQGRKLRLPPHEAKVFYSSTEITIHRDPGASVSTQGTSSMSTLALELKQEPTPTDAHTPVDGCIQSTTSTCNCTVSPKISSTSQQTTDGPTAAAATLPPPLPSDPPEVHECVDKHLQCETPTTKRFSFGKFPKLTMASNKIKSKKNSTFEDGGREFVKCGHTTQLEEHITQMRSVLDKKEEELKAVRERMDELKKHYEDQVNRLSYSLRVKDQEIQSLSERLQYEQRQYNESMGSVQNHYTQQMHNLNVELTKKRDEVEYLRHSLSEREAYIQRKMEESRSLLHQKDEELKSFKDRVAGEVALSIKTGKAESMNNPVSKSRLKEMYEELRTLWPTIKKHLNSSGRSPETVKTKLQEIFSTAMASGEEQKSQVNKLYGLDEAGGEVACQKVQEYRKATIQYVQLTLYHTGKDDVQSKLSLLEDEGGAKQAEDFLEAQCQWLGTLMALNDPPLRPDWDNHDPGMNKWDILPRNIRSFTVL